MRCLYCYNKIDQITIEEVDRLAHLPTSCVVSCEQGLNLDYLVTRIWETLDLIRVYTKRRGGTEGASQTGASPEGFSRHFRTARFRHGIDHAS